MIKSCQILKLMFVLTGSLLMMVVEAANEPLVLNEKRIGKYAEWGFSHSEDGKPWFAYYDTKNFLRVRRPDGNEVALGATDRPRQQSGLVMMPADNGISVLWRDKLPRKHLYLFPKLDPTGVTGAPLVVGGKASEPLTRLKMTQVDGVNYLLWLGEKGDKKTREKYHLYFRTVEPDGKTLSPVEQVMPGRYPAWIVDDKQIPVFSWMVLDGKLAMAMRVYDRTRKSFGVVKKIADAPSISPLFEAFKSGDRWFLLWLGHYGDGSDLLLEGVYSDDKGQHWTRFAFDELRRLDMGQIEIVTDHKGHILIALDGNRRLIDPEDTKSNVYLLRSEDNGTTWKKAQTLRPEDVRLTKARYPMLALGEQAGTVMMAWEDWRDIRPNIYVSYSRDFGATWETALPLGRPGVWNLGLDPRPRVLFSQGKDDRFSLVAKQFNDDSLRDQKEYVLYSLSWDEARKNAASFNLEEIKARATEKLLRERLSTYWQAMIKGRYETTYAMQDPFYRHRRTFKAYAANMGRIQYHSYKIKKIARVGNITKVLVEVEAAVPEFTLPSGKKYSEPKKTRSFVETWIFVNDNWYREFYDGLAEQGFTSY
ncbi:MAG: hypothetical protein CSA09_05180 [Candidatus Contendobacter odensis]|uniref:Sialidase domain-containing protein n=1 Tax=Candidatus Contendibacter odensensis TaxID=1400860 RepID=A0A2G6PE40_9GAMM|nr:MAG: hypothetical protein CSA09_05180 [Candidatus Contendobacter odensis]